MQIFVWLTNVCRTVLVLHKLKTWTETVILQCPLLFIYIYIYSFIFVYFPVHTQEGKITLSSKQSYRRIIHPKMKTVIWFWTDMLKNLHAALYHRTTAYIHSLKNSTNAYEFSILGELFLFKKLLPLVMLWVFSLSTLRSSYFTWKSTFFEDTVHFS